MNAGFIDIFVGSSRLQLSSIIGLALFFAVIGIRETRNERPEGSLYFVIAVFLTMAHAVLLDNLASVTETLGPLDSWGWLVSLLAPALIILFLARGLFDIVRHESHHGLLKLFFGLTLFCFVFMVGCDWPMDVRAILTLTWVVFLFKVELAISG